MRNTHSKFIDKILKEVWSKIDIKLVEGIYTEDFLKSLYETLSEYVDEDFAYEFLQEIEKTSGKEKETGEEKDFDSEKLDMMTAAEREQHLRKKKQDIDEKTYVRNKKTGNVYQVKTVNPANHDIASKKDIEKAKSKEKGEQPKEEPTTVNRDNFDKKDKLHKDNPKGPTRKQILDDLNNGDINVLSEYQDGVSSNRAKGISGAGGAVASEGESKYCEAVDTDWDKWTSENLKSIERVQVDIKNRDKSADEKRTAKHLGLEPDSEEFSNYLAQREVYANQKLSEIKKDKDSVFYKKGKKGFSGNDDAYKAWMNASFDGSQGTQRALNESNIDTSKPKKTIQSTEEVDQAVTAHFEDGIKNAKTPEDKKYYEKQLKNFNKFKSYHDTYVIGKDENGRTTYMGISNKKDDQIRDPQNNTTPKKRFKELEQRYGKEVATGVTNSLQENVKAVSDVKGTTVRNASDIEINDDYVAMCDTEEMKPYIQKLRDNGKFRDYVKEKGLNPDDMGTKDLLLEMNKHSKELTESGVQPAYEPYGKIAIKVGEFSGNGKFRRENPNLNFENESIQKANDIKESEKSVVKDSHTKVVSDLVEADKPDGYSDDNPDADNGPHQQGYISGVLDACHIDTYIDMDTGDDSSMLLQMGINSVKPSMIRDCIAERSGFKGNASTPEGKKALKDHLRKRCRVTPGGDRITITDNGKEVELFEDTWRTAGTSQKVASGFGKGMRNCLQGKAAV